MLRDGPLGHSELAKSCLHGKIQKFGFSSEVCLQALKPKHNLMKIAQTLEDFHGGAIWPVLTGQVPRLEAGSG